MVWITSAPVAEPAPASASLLTIRFVPKMLGTSRASTSSSRGRNGQGDDALLLEAGMEDSFLRAGRHCGGFFDAPFSSVVAWLVKCGLPRGGPPLSFPHGRHHPQALRLRGPARLA